MRATKILALVLISGCATAGEPRRDSPLDRGDLDRARSRAGSAEQPRPAHPSLPLEANGAGEVARAWAFDQGLFTQVRSVERRDEQFIVQLEVVKPQPGSMTVAVHASTGAVTPSLAGTSGAATPSAE